MTHQNFTSFHPLGDHMLVDVSILSTGVRDVSPCLLIQVQGRKYLFNCGEGFQRFCLENQVRMQNLAHVFLTNLLPKSIGGLPGMILTNSDANLHQLHILGPSNLSRAFIAMRPWFFRPKLPLLMSEFHKNSKFLTFKNQDLTVTCLIITPSKIAKHTNIQPDSVSDTLPKDIYTPCKYKSHSVQKHNRLAFRNISLLHKNVSKFESTNTILFHPGEDPSYIAKVNRVALLKSGGNPLDLILPQPIVHSRDELASLPKSSNTSSSSPSILVSSIKPHNTPNISNSPSKSKKRQTWLENILGIEDLQNSQINSNLLDTVVHIPNLWNMNGLSLPVWPSSKSDGLEAVQPCPNLGQNCCYIIKLPDIPGNFNPKKAKDLGLPPGPLFKNLSNGESVTFTHPKTQQLVTIHPSDIISPSTPGSQIAIIDIPSVEYIPSCIEQFQQYTKNLTQIYHFSSKSIIYEKSMTQWIQSLPEIQHIFVGEGMAENELLLKSAAIQQFKLHMFVDSEIYPLPFHSPPHSLNSKWFNSDGSYNWAKIYETSISQFESTRNPLSNSTETTPDILLSSLLLGESPSSSSSSTTKNQKKSKNKKNKKNKKTNNPAIIPFKTKLAKGCFAFDTFGPNAFNGSSMLKSIFAPLKRQGFDCSQVRADTHESLLVDPIKITTQLFTALKSTLKPLPLSALGHAIAQTKSPPRPWLKDNFKVVFLGTGAAMPAKYRNVSGTLVRIYKNGIPSSVFLDCGESTFGQLYRHYGPGTTDDILVQTSIIFLSHKHADHHLGVLRILIERAKVFSKRNLKLKPVTIIGPRKVWRWIWEYRYALLGRHPNYKSPFTPYEIHMGLHGLFSFNYIDNHLLINVESINEKQDPEMIVQAGYKAVPVVEPIWSNRHAPLPFLRRITFHDTHMPRYTPLACISASSAINHLLKNDDFGGLTHVETVPVHHCSQAYGFILKSEKWCIVFSGDTRPIPTLIQRAKTNQCTIMIHEATFEDDLREDALSKDHSTVAEAIDVGNLSGAWRTCLTHFSQRYPKFPDIEGSLVVSDEIVGCSLEKVRPPDPPCVIAFDSMTIDNFYDFERCPSLNKYLRILFSPEIFEIAEDGTRSPKKQSPIPSPSSSPAPRQLDPDPKRKRTEV